MASWLAPRPDAAVLEGRAGVVVEAAHEPGRHGERHAERRSPAWTRAKAAAASSDTKLGDRRRRGHELGVLGALRVEHPQRVPGERLATLLGQRIEVGPEVLPQGVEVARSIAGVAEGVEVEADLAQTEGLVEAPAAGR